MALAVWLVAGVVVDLWQRCGRGAFGQRLARLMRLPRADWGRAMAHAGFGVVIFGIVSLTTWAVEDIRVVKVGETFDLGPYQVQLLGFSDEVGPNYTAKRADMRVTKNGAEVAMLRPAKRTYPIAGMATTEAAIRPGIFGDIYLVVGDPQDGGGYAVRSYLKPFAIWLWIGGMMLALGGMLSLSDRRFRVAAGARRTSDAVVAAE